MSPGWQRDLPVSPASWPPKLQRPGWKRTGLADPQPGAWWPAWGRVSVSLWGQANGLAGISGAGAGVCNKIHPGQSVGLCSAVV